MLRKCFVICLVGWLSIVSVPNVAWANSVTTSMRWLAQENVQLMPSEQPDIKAHTKTDKSSSASSRSSLEHAEQMSSEQPPAQQKSQTKPFNPYDMKALKQFDKGSHRAQ